MITRDKLFADLAKTNAYWNTGVTFKRTNPVPIENYSVFKTLDEAKTYAFENVVAYPGQTLAVVASDNNVTLYVIAAGATSKDNALIELSTSSGLAGEAGRVDAIIEEINANIKTIQSALDQAELDIDALEGRAKDLEDRATAVEGRATALEGRAKDLEDRAGGFDTEIATLKKADENLTAAIATAKQEAIDHANSLKHFSTKIVAAESEMAEANVLYLMLDDNAVKEGRKDVYLQYLVIDGSPVCIGDTTTDLDDYYTEAEADAEIAAAVSAAKEELQGNIDGLASTHNKDKGALEDAIDAVAEDLAQEVTDRKAADNALDAKIAANKTDIGTNAQAIEDLAALVASNESDIEGKMTAVNTRVDNAELRMDNIQDQIDGLNSTYATDAELAAVQDLLEKDIDAEVETINAALANRYLKDEVYTKGQTDDKITAALQGLDVPDTAVAKHFVTAVSEVDGIVVISRAQPSHSDINGFDAQVAVVAQPLVDAEKERALGIESGLDSRISTLETFKDTTVPATYATKTALNDVDTAQKATAAELTKYKTDNDKAVAAVAKDVEDLGARHDSELSALTSNIDKDYLKKTLKINAVEYDATNNKYTIAPSDIGADVAGTAETLANQAETNAKTAATNALNTYKEQVTKSLGDINTNLTTNYVKNTLKVNGQAIGTNNEITLTHANVGADAAGTAEAQANAALTTAKGYTDTKKGEIEEAYKAADSALGDRIDGIINDTYVKYNTDIEFIIDCGNAAGTHPVYNT